MFIAIYRDPNTNQLLQVTWKAGLPSPFKKVPELIWNVGEVRASGEELEVIKLKYTHIPMVDPFKPGAEVVWYGDHAKFVAGNLP